MLTLFQNGFLSVFSYNLEKNNSYTIMYTFSIQYIMGQRVEIKNDSFAVQRTNNDKVLLIMSCWFLRAMRVTFSKHEELLPPPPFFRASCVVDGPFEGLWEHIKNIVKGVKYSSIKNSSLSWSKSASPLRKGGRGVSRGYN